MRVPSGPITGTLRGSAQEINATRERPTSPASARIMRNRALAYRKYGPSAFAHQHEIDADRAVRASLDLHRAKAELLVERYGIEARANHESLEARASRARLDFGNEPR